MIGFCISAIKARIWMVVGGALLGAVVLVGYRFTQEPRLAARSVIVLPPDLSAAPILMMRSGGTLQTVVGIAESFGVRSNVASRNGLSYDDTVKNLQVSANELKNLVVLSCDAYDTERNLAIVSAATDELRDRLAYVNSTAFGTRAEQLKKQLDAKEEELRAAEERYVAFQRGMKTTPDAVSSVKLLAEARFNLLSAEKRVEALKARGGEVASNVFNTPSQIEPLRTLRTDWVQLVRTLDTLKGIYGPEHPEIREHQNKLNAAERALRAEAERYRQSVQQDSSPEVGLAVTERDLLKWQVAELERIAAAAPDTSRQWEGLKREIAILSELVGRLRTEMEMARVNANVDGIRWVVLDPPSSDPRPVNRRLALTVVQGVLAGLLLSAAWVCGSSAMRQAVRGMGRPPKLPR